MTEALPLLWAWAAGAVLGAIFFGGLWWTVRRGMASSRPALWFLASLLLRTALVLAGFYVVADGHWQRLLLAVVGFFIAKLVVTRFAPSGDAAAREASHAP